MKVVLTQDVPGLGERLQVKEVADGYARNYLFPRRLAVPGSSGALHDAVKHAEQAETRLARQQAKRQAAADGLSRLAVTIRARAGSAGKLYGAITPALIAQALKDQHQVEVDRRKIRLKQPIRELGEYLVPVALGGGVSGNVAVRIVEEQQ